MALLETGAACSGACTYGSRLTGVASVISGSKGGVTSELADRSKNKKILLVISNIINRLHQNWLGQNLGIVHKVQ